jgi:hypothetical protein
MYTPPVVVRGDRRDGLMKHIKTGYRADESSKGQGTGLGMRSLPHKASSTGAHSDINKKAAIFYLIEYHPQQYTEIDVDLMDA